MAAGRTECWHSPRGITDDEAYWSLPIGYRAQVAHNALLMCVLYGNIKPKNHRQDLRRRMCKRIGDEKEARARKLMNEKEKKAV